MKTNYYLIKAFNELGKEQEEVIKDLGKSQPYVSALMRGKKNIGKKVAKELSDLYGFDFASMLAGEMLNELPKKEPPTIYKSETNTKGSPLIPIEAVAGFGTEDNTGVKYEDCDHYIIPEFDARGMDFLIRVSGSSMYPKYSNGDVLACKKIHEITFFQWGKIYVIDSNQGALVKRLFEDKDNANNVICVSDNKENYPPFPLPKEDIRSLSIVLGVVRME